MTVRFTDKRKTRGGILLGCLTAVVATLHASSARSEFDDLADPGSFDEQNHSIGPTLYAAFGDEGTRQITVGLGVQLGLNEATSDAALKLDAQFEF